MLAIKRISCCLVFCLCLSGQTLLTAADTVRLPHIFSNNMVLQRGIEIPVWGKAQENERVTVTLNGKTATAQANASGFWLVKLPALNAGGPYEMKVENQSGKKITFKNVLIGDVWICSGQSNMKFRVKTGKHAPEEISAANYPNIRLFTVPNRVSDQPEDEVGGKWEICSENSIPDFSAVAYFFGRDLYKTLQIPQGLINTAWGGTPAESWTTIETLRANPEFASILKRYERATKNYPVALKKYETLLANWKKFHKEELDRSLQKDPGNKGFALGWAKSDFADANWKTMELPRYWETLMDIDGAVWFRKEITIPPNWAGKDLLLSLGAIDDFDVTYFNGSQVGMTDKTTPDSWQYPRKYSLSGKLVKSGRAVIAIRVFDNYGNGGFNGSARQMSLRLKSGGKPISLATNWRYKVSIKLDPTKLVPNRRPRRPLGKGSPYSPAGLYNGMIHPLAPYAIKGAIWYQGESNANRAAQYRQLLPALISDWRRVWKQGNFPFLIVQLANFKAPKKKPQKSSWAELREAQLLTLTASKNTGLAVIIDLGEAKNIHPKNKQDVGKRLALAARAIAYGEKIVYSGPLYEKMEVVGNKIRLLFSHVGGGLVAKGGDLKYFAIAGADKKFVWGKATIVGDTVVVESEKVKTPVAVRYAWADNPEGCNLYNKENLPASPFRTDQWKN